MADGFALGEGAEAFSRNLNAALRFRQARAEQQFQQGLALERKELAEQRVDLERRRIELSQEEVQRGITQRETLEKEIEDLLTTATGPRGQVAENITKTPQFRRKAIRLKAKGVDVDKLLGIEEAPTSVGERSRNLYVGIMGKIRAGTATDTDLDQLSFITGNYRNLDDRAVPKTSDIKNVYAIASQGYTEKEWQNLDPVDMIRAVNITGRRQVENWIDQVVPYRIKFKNIRLGRDEHELVYATPEQVDLIKRAEQDRDSGRITQEDFEEALQGILETE